MTTCHVEEVDTLPHFQQNSSEAFQQRGNPPAVAFVGGVHLVCTQPPSPPSASQSHIGPMAGVYSNINKVSDPSRDDEFYKDGIVCG